MTELGRHRVRCASLWSDKDPACRRDRATRRRDRRRLVLRPSRRRLQPPYTTRERDYAGVRLRRRPTAVEHLDAGTHTLLCVLECI